MRWSNEKKSAALAAHAAGLSQQSVADLVGVPPATVGYWVRHEADYIPRRTTVRRPYDRDAIPSAPYAYLLGAYLGDGFISRQTNGSWLLRIVSDSAYPGILDEFADAMEAVSGGKAWRRKKKGENCYEIGLTWWHWTLAFPQHGPGRKHKRNIELEPWQWDIVKEHTGPFLRGLIHSDGWRGVNKVFSKGRWYEYPRYQFSNRSEDIKKLFCDACDLIGVEWRLWGRYHVSVAKRDSVAKLDEFVGLKY